MKEFARMDEIKTAEMDSSGNLIAPSFDIDIEEVKPPTAEWKIDADINLDKKRRALEDLEDGMTVRRVARHLGILAEKITRK